MAWWANPERIGVIVLRDGVLTYLDTGPDYEAAVASGPGAHTEIPEVPAIPDPRPPADSGQSGPKWTGVEFEGVMCSATADDQAGLAAVLVAIQLQGAAFAPTRFYFANGSTLVLSLSNYAAFAAVWLPFRQSFFSVD